MQLPLTSTEADLLQRAGTVLETVIEPTRKPYMYTETQTPHQQFLQETAMQLPEGVGLFMLLTDCAYLQPVQNGMAACAIFGEPQRPAVCSGFTAGGPTCRTIRLTRGVWDF
jgi:hypothetical protein